MTHRSRNVLAVAALLALAACGGGGGSRATPLTLSAAAPAPGGAADTFAMPQSAPAGIRTFVHLPLRNSDELDNLIEQQSTKDAPLYHHWLTPAQFRDAYGPSTSDLHAAAQALAAGGFHTTVTSQMIVADAPQSTVERTFGLHLRAQSQSIARQTYSTLTADRAPALPAALTRLNAQVLAFGAVHLRHPEHMRAQTGDPENRYGGYGPYWFDDLKQAYQYPAYAVARGAGRTIAVLAASDYSDSDMASYFGHEHLPVPAIERKPVSGGPPPFDPNSGYSDEVNLDIQQAGGSAPGAKILVYGAADPSDSSFVAMYTAVAEDNLADVVSVSYGECELDYTAPFNNGVDLTWVLQLYHDLFRQMNAQGMTIVNSSGDFGALECTDPSGATAKIGVSSWANDPNVTGVGGTNLVTTYIKGSLESKYVRESAFYDKFNFADPNSAGLPSGVVWGSGGGKSVFFSRPNYQRLVNTHTGARAVPDVAMHMGGCPVGAYATCESDRSSDVAALGGQFFMLIGASASAPEFAGLQAIQDGVLGSRQGNVNNLLYSLAAAGSFGHGPIFNDAIPGNNGYFSTTRGYNYVLGNGTVNGAQYVFEPFGPFAGNPQTPSNP